MEIFSRNRPKESTDAAGGHLPPEMKALLETVSMHDSNQECYADADNPLYDAFLRGTSSELFKWHHYFDIYHRFFQQYRETESLRVLEIGVRDGGSLQLWRDYFHDSSTIVGVDVDPSCERFEDESENTFVRIGDQADPKFLGGLVDEFSSFDIVVDDGGHTANQQITSFAHLYPTLSADGTYLVEDTHTSLWKKFQDRPDKWTFLDLAKALVDHLHDPYRVMSKGYPLRVGNPDKLDDLMVSRFYGETKSISFFDSIVVFNRGKRAFPKVEIRTLNAG